MAKRRYITLPGGRTVKTVTLLVSLVLVVALTMAGTLALLLDRTGDVQNTFTTSKVGCEVLESGKVQVTKGDEYVRAYLRAAVVVTWQREVDGKVEIFSVAPDYEVSYDGWIKGSDGYYYWPTPVDPGKATADGLKAELVKGATAPEEGYIFTVEIAAQAIQADGTKTDGAPAVEDAWKVVTIGSDGVTLELK